MTFLFISLASCVVLQPFSPSRAIDHFAEIWETSDAGTWHGRFSLWATDNRHLDILRGISGLAAAFSCLTFVVAFYYALTFVDVAGERHFALFVTGGSGAESREGLRAFFVTKAELERIPMFDYVDSQRIVKGRISSALPIGGGLAHICIDNGNYCGLADSSLGLQSATSPTSIGRPPSRQGRPPAGRSRRTRPRRSPPPRNSKSNPK